MIKFKVLEYYPYIPLNDNKIFIAYRIIDSIDNSKIVTLSLKIYNRYLLELH
jgi:hypothetical protein